MFNKKKIAAGLAAACLPLMMVAISVPAASAETGVASTVEAKDQCEWGIGGFTGNLTLSSETKYEGEALAVSATITGLTLGLSGALDENNGISGSSTECSFYNDPQQGIARFTLGETTSFAASYGAGVDDDDMDFTLTQGNGLDLAADDDDIASCTGFSNNDADFRNAADDEDIFLMSSVNNLYGAGSGPRCSPSIVVSTTIPASTGAPAGAGQIYSFSGPSLTITLQTSDVVAPE